ncbi:serine/threonine protein kinase [Phormidium sp. CCY1219]|nr:serine/threonine-protein kinase [Phormidium sp. CCY1219]MEB3829955.1 serine/threonine protein kinase [Phormidium sp. CCY1219]
MEIHCTRPSCPRPQNEFADLDDPAELKTAQQKFCTACGMPLILDGRYMPQRLLGQGGFGAAFLACDRRTPTMRQCVVKQFQPRGDLNAQQMAIAQKLFDREAEVLDDLGNRHPQIPDLLAFFPLEVPSLTPGKQEQFFYLVQEFIDGENLEEQLQSKGKFSETEVVEVLQQILKILQFVHQNQVIHRDIKPSNIMRSRHSDRLYLLDFGAVKQVTQASLAPGTNRSTGIYSMGFAPPEQMAGRTVFPATDLYALAVTCIMLLTGKDPQTLFDSYTNRWNWRSDAEIDEKLADILDRLLLPTPSQRFQSATEVLEALVAKPSAPPPPTPAPPIPAPTPSPAPAPPVQPSTAHFTTLEILRGAAFTGFEGGLLLIVLSSLNLSALISTGAWVVVLSGLILAQSRRWIEKYDLLILAIATFAIVVAIPSLRSAFAWQAIFLLPLFAGSCAIAVSALFRLLQKFLSRIL